MAQIELGIEAYLEDSSLERFLSGANSLRIITETSVAGGLLSVLEWTMHVIEARFQS